MKKATFITVEHLPNRRKPCLVLSQWNEEIVLGTFKNGQCAAAFEKFIGGSLLRNLDEELEEFYEGADL